ncbi:histidine kinase [Halogeometricum pallidum JCM 14848]|uniref:histidine kinase n=1 Tax=Halogeometricum pallidum JCM 14848 TaxID=1227487 RepID=M0D5F0_HALPD|nr:HAMP domain-containing sensor histidine kinase [Halogeometricum pallidum]ELZ30058.1 histidine kinase [Halogeometricum pallidum JCM 14848]
MLTRVLTLAERVGFGSPPESVARQSTSAVRVAASGLVALTGLVLLVPNLAPLLRGADDGVVVVLSLLGSVVSVGLVAAGGLLYRSRFTDRNAARIAVWNLLGVVVLGGVMTAHAAAQGSFAGGVDASAFTVGNLLAIGAAAHVIIGVYDARRVRAEQLARQRRQTAVLNRVLRHNLRNEAQVLTGHADIVAGAADGDGTLARSVAALQRSSAAVSSLADGARAITQAQERAASEYVETDLSAVARAAVDGARERHPEATVRLDAEAGLDATVLGSKGVRTALDELVKNSLEHGGAAVDVGVYVSPDAVELRVSDDGPGIPTHERDVVTGDAEITSLTHGSGLGLWVVEAVASSHGATLAFADREGGGSVVSLTFPRRS